MNAKYTMGRSWIIILFIAPVCRPYEVEIIEPRGSSNGIKIHAEFELSLFTERLGFVDDEYLLYGTPWHRILKQYITFTRTSTVLLAYDTKITRPYFGENYQRNEKLCKAYLSDETFSHNNIQYAGISGQYSIRYLQKPVRLQYFPQAQDQRIKVIGCPVIWAGYNGIMHLFFQEIWTHSPSTQRNWYRGYYVFANIPEFEGNMQPIELLMFTAAIKHQLLPEPDQSDEEYPVRGRQRQMSNAPRVRLHSSGDTSRLRLFGSDAELHFRMKTYGFVDVSRSLWKRTRLVSFLDQMKQGYELNERQLSGIRNKQSPSAICKNFIENSNALSQYDIHFRPELIDIDTSIVWITKLVKFRTTKILKAGRYYDLLPCPISGYEGKDRLYILPVYYLNPDKQPQLFTFFDPEGNENEVDENEDDEGEEEENEDDGGEVNEGEVYDNEINENEVIPFILSAANPKQPHQTSPRASTSSLPVDFQRLGIEE